MDNRNDKDIRRDNEGGTPKPDPETLHKTDPQENMEGPVSSLMHGTGEQFDTEETQGEADKEKEDSM
jgi:hypothetical protein